MGAGLQCDLGVYDDDFTAPGDDHIWTITVDGVSRKYAEIGGELYPFLNVAEVSASVARLDRIMRDSFTAAPRRA